MEVGKDFFKILNFAIGIIKLFLQIFGDEQDREAVAQSKARTANGSPDDVC